MRFLLLFLSIVWLASPAAQAARPLPTPKLVAVYAYADWCPNCKLFTPEWQKVQVQLNSEDILFITFDLTDKPRIHQALMLAKTIGLGDYLRAQGSSTGYAAVLDATTHKERMRFDRTHTAQQMVERIRQALE